MWKVERCPLDLHAPGKFAVVVNLKDRAACEQRRRKGFLTTGRLSIFKHAVSLISDP